MAYAGYDDAVALYGAEYVDVAFDRDGDGDVDTAAVELMFDVVSAEIDSYLVGRVPTLPLDPVTKDIVMRCVDMCIYRMCPDASRLSKEKTDRFNAAIQWLGLVARNEIKLTNGAGQSTGANSVAKARLVTAVEAANGQRDNARWFKRANIKEIL